MLSWLCLIARGLHWLLAKRSLIGHFDALKGPGPDSIGGLTFGDGVACLTLPIGQTAADPRVLQVRTTRRPDPARIFACLFLSRLSDVAANMSTQYNYQYQQQAAAPVYSQGVSMDGTLTSSMASMSLAGGADQHQPSHYAASQLPAAQNNTSGYPPTQNNTSGYPPAQSNTSGYPLAQNTSGYPVQAQATYAPSAPANGYGAVAQPYGVQSMPYQTTNSVPAQQISNAPQVSQQSAYSQAPNSPYLVSTTSIRPSPGSLSAAAAPNNTPASVAPTVNRPLNNNGVQYPSQYNVPGSGIPPVSSTSSGSSGSGM